jgi:hypothetical protein
MALLKTIRLLVGQRYLYSSFALLFNNIKPTSVQKLSRIKLYYALALPFLSYGSGIWTLRKKDKIIYINRDKIFQKNCGENFFDHRRNEEILEKLKVEPVDEKLRRYKSNWPRHVKIMNNNRMPKIMLNYRVDARIRLGRTSKRLLEEARTGLLRPSS